MPRYSDERRQAVVAKLLPPYNQSVERSSPPGRYFLSYGLQVA